MLLVKVTKFEPHTAYRFSTAEGRPSMWADPKGLFTVKDFIKLLGNSPNWDYITIMPLDKSRSVSHLKITNYILLKKKVKS